MAGIVADNAPSCGDESTANHLKSKNRNALGESQAHLIFSQSMLTRIDSRRWHDLPRPIKEGSRRTGCGQQMESRPKPVSGPKPSQSLQVSY